MMAVEWNKKEDLVAEQAMKHLRIYTPLLASTAKTPKAELALMLRVQEYCYENMNFLKSFQKIIIMLYKSEWIICSFTGQKESKRDERSKDVRSLSYVG